MRAERGRGVGGAAANAALLREAMRGRVVVARFVDAVAGPAFRETLATEDSSTLDQRPACAANANEHDEQGEGGLAHCDYADTKITRDLRVI